LHRADCQQQLASIVITSGVAMGGIGAGQSSPNFSSLDLEIIEKSVEKFIRRHEYELEIRFIFIVSLLPVLVVNLCFYFFVFTPALVLSFYSINYVYVSVPLRCSILQ